MLNERRKREYCNQIGGSVIKWRALSQFLKFRLSDESSKLSGDIASIVICGSLAAISGVMGRTS